MALYTFFPHYAIIVLSSSPLVRPVILPPPTTHTHVASIEAQCMIHLNVMRVPRELISGNLIPDYFPIPSCFVSLIATTSSSTTGAWASDMHGVELVSDMSQ